METRFKIAARNVWEAEAIILFTLSGDADRSYAGQMRTVDASLPWLEDLGALGDFPGKAGSTLLVHDPAGTGTSLLPRVILAGLGSEDALDLETFRNASAAAMGVARKFNLESVGLDLDSLEGLPFSADVLLQEFVFAANSGLYKYLEFKTKDTEARVPDRLRIFSENKPKENARIAMERGLAEYAGVELARDLVNGPSNLVTPEYMAQAAGELAREYGYGIEVLEPQALSEMGMGAFEAVFKGSANPARLVVLDSLPSSEEQPLLFVGKGVTFDTGGISIKPSANMEKMKGDMGGAAAVLGFFKSLGEMSELHKKRRVVGVIPLTDNMPDGRATKPGDIVTTLSGQTVEIINTDAEGRLILCDAITHGLGWNPSLIVDMATLTGACVVALGSRVAGVFTNRDVLAENVKNLSQETGEQTWPLPVLPHYLEELNSQVADLKNVGSRMGGASMAAMFLKQFVPDEIPWLHIDIAGPAFSDKNNGHVPRGGTGFGVRTLVQIAENHDSFKSL